MQTLFRIMAVLLALAIATLSLLPLSGQASIQNIDKVQHFLAYGALAGLIGLGWRDRRVALAVLLAFAFGLGVEVAQGVSSTGRTPSLADAIANLAGALVAGLCLPIARKVFAPR